MAVGKILRYDEVRGYGFIASAASGEDVFVHVNDFGDQRHLVRVGLPVEFEVEEGDRGLKVSYVRALETSAAVAWSDKPAAESAPRDLPARDVPARDRDADSEDDDGLCDLVSARQFRSEVAEGLIQQVPSLTGAQITQVRSWLESYGRSHGWIED